jgi:hypothetical protein
VRTPSNHQSNIPLATISNLDQRTLHYPYRPRKLVTLEITTETKSPYRILAWRITRLQLQTPTRTQETPHGGRRPITTLGSQRRKRQQPTDDNDPRSSIHQTIRTRFQRINRTYNFNHPKPEPYPNGRMDRHLPNRTRRQPRWIILERYQKQLTHHTTGSRAEARTNEHMARRIHQRPPRTR